MKFLRGWVDGGGRGITADSFSNKLQASLPQRSLPETPSITHEMLARSALSPGSGAALGVTRALLSRSTVQILQQAQGRAPNQQQLRHASKTKNTQTMDIKYFGIPTGTLRHPAKTAKGRKEM